MKIVFLTHPNFMGSQSMPRFAKMLSSGMSARKHEVEVWSPPAIFFNLPFPKSLKKWLGYIDQYICFPIIVRKRLRSCQSDTLFVFTDQALGPWVPLVSNRPHVIHCHDFLAQRSAKGEIAENPTGWTGKQYQTFIRQGYSKGKNFISVSQNTKKDLHKFLNSKPLISEVIYNGLNPLFKFVDPVQARSIVSKRFNLNLENGYFLHVGGNQWYKNRIGVIEIYNAWRSLEGVGKPLLLIGEPPNSDLLVVYNASPFKNQIHFLSKVEDESIHLAYAGASAFLFPSLAEGFGWPIAEAMASGCQVITTNEAPMTEVAGNAAYLIPCRSQNSESWANSGADTINEILTLSSHESETKKKAAIENCKRFDNQTVLNQIEDIYENILNAIE